MKLGIMQPYFLPYYGYFQLMKYVDKYVIADDVNYIKQGYINRNSMLLCGKKFMFHLDVVGASINKWINQIDIAGTQMKLLKTFEVNYRKAPYFKDFYPVLENICRCEDKNLARFVGNSLMLIADYLHFDTEFAYESDSEECDRTLEAQARVISDCVLFGAKDYINAIGGTVLYNKEEFKKAGVNLYFLKPRSIEYKQFNNEFIPNLSIMDVLMFNSVEQTNELLMEFDLV